jgi:hypothetical protein
MREVGWIPLKALLKLDVFDKSISGGKVNLIFQNAHCKERMRKLFVFRDGMYLSRVVYLLWFTYRCCKSWLLES